MEGIQDSLKATSHGYQVDESKRYCQSEVRYLLQQLGSWREESNKQFSNIIDSHTNIINKDIKDLAEAVGDLKTRLGVITQEKNNLLKYVKKLRGENRNLKAAIHIVQPLPDLEENQNRSSQGDDCVEVTNHNNKEQRVDSHGNCHDPRDPEKELYDVESAFPIVVNENPLNDQYEWNNLPKNIKKLSRDNRNLKPAIKILQPLPDLEENQKQGSQRGDCPEVAIHSNKERRISLPRNCHDSGVPEQELINVESVDPTVLQENETTSNDPYELIDSNLHGYDDVHEIEIKHEALYGEVTGEGDTDQHQKGNVNVLSLPSEEHICPECGSVFSTGGYLKIHIKKLHQNLEPGKDCSRREVFKITTSRGVKSHNKTKQGEKLECDRCHFKTFRKDNLRLHLKFVHKMEEKRFKCKQCPYAAHAKSNFRRHIEGVHDKIRDHKCEHCERSFSIRSNLMRHRKTVHNIT